MAGDMTVYGLRDNVKLIREDANGKQQIVTLDLNKAETILSPYYWLQQNDIVYVTPNKAKAQLLCQLPICLFHKIHFSRFQTCWRRTAFYAVCGRQVHRG